MKTPMNPGPIDGEASASTWIAADAARPCNELRGNLGYLELCPLHTRHSQKPEGRRGNAFCIKASLQEDSFSIKEEIGDNKIEEHQ